MKSNELLNQEEEFNKKVYQLKRNIEYRNKKIDEHQDEIDDLKFLNEEDEQQLLEMGVD